MRVLSTPKLLLVAAAGLIAVGLVSVAPIEQPSPERNVTLVVEAPALDDCPYLF